MSSTAKSDQVARSRWPPRIWAILGALGILSALGAWLFNAARETASDVLFDPIIVHLAEQPASHDDFYLFPESADPADAPTDPPAFRKWARSVHAVPYGVQGVKLVVRGRETTPVAITDVRIRVTDRRRLTGTWINSSPIGGDLPSRQFSGDLQRGTSSPQLYDTAGEEVAAKDFFVSSTDPPEIFYFTVCATEGITSWVIEIDYDAEDKAGTFTVEDQGRSPFRLAGGGNPAAYQWQPHSGKPSTLEPVGKLDRDIAGSLCW